VERDAAKRGLRFVAGLGLALAAAVGFGLWFVAIDLASTDDPYWAATVAQLTSAAVALLLVAWRRGPRIATELGATATAPGPGSRSPRSATRLFVLAALAAGLSDAVAVLTFAISTTYGMLSIVSVIAALYPAFMVGFAAVFLHERPARHQLAGVVMALVGIALITGGGA
jgi:drug/metabolite transporter (DMT)-like permease